MRNKKGFSTKLIVTIIAVVVLVAGIFALSKSFSSKKDGTIEVEIVNLEGKTINDKSIDYQTGDTLVSLLESNFDNVKVEDGMLYTIDELTTPEDWSTYICIYVDDQMSQVGIEEIQFKDGTKISFVDTELNYE